jgi:hypothetical protein
MSPQIQGARLRWFDVLGFLAMIVLVAGVAWLPAQETQPTQKSTGRSDSDPRDQRLDASAGCCRAAIRSGDSNDDRGDDGEVESEPGP